MVDNNPYQVVVILIKYFYYVHSYTKNEILNSVIDFLNRYYPRYKINESQWISNIEKTIKNIKEQKLHEISGVKITALELNVIRSLKDRYMERLLFAMLCLAKLNNLKNPNNNGWVCTETKKVYVLARYFCKKDMRDININKLYKAGYLELPSKNGNLNFRINFIDDIGDEVLFVTDFRELGYEYMAYCGENFIRCKECGILIRNNKTKTKKYCKTCGSFSCQKTKQLYCSDCGIRFTVSSKNNKTNRCPRCQQVYRKEYNKIKQREVRKSKGENNE